MYIKNQSFLVAGLSRSGIASAKFLALKGAKTFIFDDIYNDYIDTAIKELEPLGCINLSKEEIENKVNEIDILVLSPGVPIDNYLPVIFRRKNKRIIGEMELGANATNAPLIAVTGTNGKTTTVSLISEILNRAQISNVLCGNIGTPITSVIDELNSGSIGVVEVSSFQLETLFFLKPHIAVITNITPDHLNRHYNLENYIYLKSKILQNIRESEFAILNFDDLTVRNFAENLRAKVKWFSLTEKVDGCYLQNNTIFYSETPIIDVSELTIKGKHNVANAMTAILTAKVLGISNCIIKEGLKEFKGVKHRIEFLYEIDGVFFYNDSKGTNVESAIKAVESMERPTIILLGGRDKGYDYNKLFETLKGSNVCHAVIFGENKFKLIDSAKKCNYNEISVCSDLICAVKFAKMMAKRGDSILLSPASSSFDVYLSYEERGEAFKKIVEGLMDEKVPSI